MLKYLDSHCEPGKCCICARECLCFTLSEDQFVLAHKWEIEDRLKRGGPYQTYEKALMRKTLDDMEMEEREAKEKEYMNINDIDVNEIKEIRFDNKSYVKSENVEEEKKIAYKAGLEEAWEIARKVAFDLDAATLRDIFDRSGCNILRDISIHEVKEKIAAYEAEQAKPKLGDVVEIGDIGEFLFLGEGREHYYVLDPSDNDGIPHQFVIKHTANSIRKTGKHFDIKSMLDEIG